MNRSAILAVVAATLLITACATTTRPAAPAPEMTGESRFLIDPRTGYAGVGNDTNRKQFDAAWRLFQQGDLEQARRRVEALRTRHPEYTPAALLEAAIDIRQKRLDEAATIVQRIADREPDYTAARVYEAEVALAQGNSRRAYDIYRSLQSQPGALPTIAERLQTVREAVFNELYNAARNASDRDAVSLLREALEINPGVVDARILLARRLIAQKQYDEARRELEPVVNSADLDRPDVQEQLAEIDVGRGRYQEAIVRYDRLARRTREPRYASRLNEIKQEWSAANMPPQVKAALETPEITRADLAVLLYWNVNAVRFAQNLSTPEIAIDIGDVAEREEIIRAIALGLYDVDPVTRRVGPTRPVTAAMFSRILQRLLSTRGATCARDTTADRVLAACGVIDPAATASPDSPVSGRTAATVLESVEKAFAR